MLDPYPYRRAHRAGSRGPATIVARTQPKPLWTPNETEIDPFATSLIRYSALLGVSHRFWCFCQKKIGNNTAFCLVAVLADFQGEMARAEFEGLSSGRGCFSWSDRDQGIGDRLPLERGFALAKPTFKGLGTKKNTPCKAHGPGMTSVGKRRNIMCSQSYMENPEREKKRGRAKEIWETKHTDGIIKRRNTNAKIRSCDAQLCTIMQKKEQLCTTLRRFWLILVVKWDSL